MPRHFSSGRRSRRITLPLEEVESHPQVTHLHINLPSTAKGNAARNGRRSATESLQLRARLLRMILENEAARRITKFPG
jgi:hypothetical protein